jgi:aspartyl-tRNA(Asn)/glutamyl-tRNA(Gln) amidotransferase subunit B
MRSKEDAQDYRYFPDPDLPPLMIDRAWIQEVEASLPELPEAMRRRLIEEHGLPNRDAVQLTSSRTIAEYYNEVVRLLGPSTDATRKLVSNWILGELSASANQDDIDISVSRVRPAHIAWIVKRITDGTISNNAAKDVFSRILQSGKGPRVIVEVVESSAGASDEVDAIIETAGLRQLSDASLIDEIVAKVLLENQGIVADFHAGKEKALNSLVGKVMAASRRSANPAQVNAALRRMLATQAGPSIPPSVTNPEKKGVGRRRKP